MNVTEALNELNEKTSKIHLLNKAIIIASMFHENQRDYGGQSYISHCARVAAAHMGEKYQIVGWLHDVVEDTAVDLPMLSEFGFPDEIVNAIDAISRRSGESWSTYIKRVKQNKLARRVKIADLKDNLRRDRAPGHPKVESHRGMYFTALHMLDAKMVDTEL